MTHDPTHLNGGDAIAVNPRNPNNLVYVGLKHTPPAASFPPPSVVPASPTGSQTYNCFVAYTMNRGRTWTVEPWSNDGYPSCGITTVAVTADGTFYICANQLGSKMGAGTGNGVIDNSTNHSGVVMSTDGGRTWAKPTNPPLSSEAHPKVRVDTTTGSLYVVARSWASTAAPT